jgi:hypothetical protein
MLGGGEKNISLLLPLLWQMRRLPPPQTQQC